MIQWRSFKEKKIHESGDYAPKHHAVSFQFEHSDPIYASCMWARINLDHDTFTMTATSDCGDYSYRWQVTESESFLRLMARISGSYLLDAISSQCVFDFDESKQQAVKQAKICDIDSGIYNQLLDIEPCSEESFFQIVEGLTKWDFEYIPIEKRYPAGAVTFCKLFCGYLQPILRKENDLAS